MLIAAGIMVLAVLPGIVLSVAWPEGGPGKPESAAEHAASAVDAPDEGADVPGPAAPDRPDEPDAHAGSAPASQAGDAVVPVWKTEALEVATPPAWPEGRGDGPGAVEPYETDTPTVPVSILDGHVMRTLARRGIRPALQCSDAVFFRRVHLDCIGALPDADAVKRFLKDKSADKRARIIDDLLRREEFATYWALKWCDVLRVKAEFPINLWPNAVQAYHRWIRDSLRENTPNDRFARELLTASGSNFRVPAVNFYRAMQGHEPATIAEAVAQTFMGARIAKWPEARREGLAAMFSRVGFKPTAEWKEEIVFLKPDASGELDALLPDGTTVRIAAGDDPRRVFADWLVRPDNPWFARCAVNRVWAWLFGRGIVHEPDDIRPGNPPVHPEALEYLASELVSAGYDLRHVYRLILNSRTYGQSPIPRSDHPDAGKLFASYPVRRLDAEVLIDALSLIGGSGESYSSAIPEPFTFIPSSHKTVELADGSITSQFLEMFGRPARDTGRFTERSNKMTVAQRLHLLNSTHVLRKTSGSFRLKKLLNTKRAKKGDIGTAVYLAILSRPPTAAEKRRALGYEKKAGVKSREAAEDLVWALVNTKEFLCRH
ncbi:MAG: DUF1553 domain-containing protein [Planctomycetota bacterium]